LGKNVAAAAPCSAQALYLIVPDMAAARDERRARGVEVSELFHSDGVYAGTDEPYLFGRRRTSGADPERGSYRSFASFRDPDGNGWLFQEVTRRLAGRIDSGATSFASANDLANASRREGRQDSSRSEAGGSCDEGRHGHRRSVRAHDPRDPRGGHHQRPEIRRRIAGRITSPASLMRAAGGWYSRATPTGGVIVEGQGPDEAPARGHA